MLPYPTHGIIFHGVVSVHTTRVEVVPPLGLYLGTFVGGIIVVIAHRLKRHEILLFVVLIIHHIIIGTLEHTVTQRSICLQVP